MYNYLTQYNSPNYTPKASVPAVYGQPRVVKSITIHWWGSPSTGPTFNGTINYLCRAGGNTSAHYVAETGQVACIVDPENAAWHAGNSTGNATSVGIECNPLARNGDYATVAELIRDLRSVYGNIPLVPHSYWKATACPGVYDLARLDRESRALPPDPIGGLDMPETDETRGNVFEIRKYMGIMEGSLNRNIDELQTALTTSLTGVKGTLDAILAELQKNQGV